MRGVLELFQAEVGIFFSAKFPHILSCARLLFGLLLVSFSDHFYFWEFAISGPV